jgi:hypothetical protein
MNLPYEPGHYWDNDPDWPVEDWQLEVANGDTRRSYWEWVETQRQAEEEIDHMEDLTA